MGGTDVFGSEPFVQLWFISLSKGSARSMPICTKDSEYLFGSLGNKTGRNLLTRGTLLAVKTFMKFSDYSDDLLIQLSGYKVRKPKNRKEMVEKVIMKVITASLTQPKKRARTMEGE